MGDGILKVTSWDDIRPGTILREVHRDGTSPQFADSVVVAVESDPSFGTTNVLLARPHVKVERGSIWVRLENYTVEGSRLVGEASLHRTVCLASGKAASVDFTG